MAGRNYVERPSFIPAEGTDSVTPGGDTPVITPSVNGLGSVSQQRVTGPDVIDHRGPTAMLSTSPPVHTVQAVAASAQLVQAFLVWMASAGSGRDTLRVRGRHLRDLAGVHEDLLAVTAGDLAAWLASHSWGHSARQQARATVRMFYGWLVDEDVLRSSPAARLPKVRHPRPISRPAPLHVIAAALLKARPREQRMILVARYGGLRRAEVAAVHTDHLTDTGDGHRAVVVRGKGDHERMVPLHPAVAQAVEDCRGWLFPSVRHPSGHLDPDTVGRLVSDLLGPGWAMHSLRHRAAHDWQAVSGDLVAIQELLGHASLATTRRYLPARQDVMLAAVLGVA